MNRDQQWFRDYCNSQWEKCSLIDRLLAVFAYFWLGIIISAAICAVYPIYWLINHTFKNKK